MSYVVGFGDSVLLGRIPILNRRKKIISLNLLLKDFTTIFFI